MVERFGLSQRRVSTLVHLDRETLSYKSRKADDGPLRQRIREIAEAKRRYGCRRIYIRIRRGGVLVNHKKVERIYREIAMRAKKTENRTFRMVCRPVRLL